MPKAEIFIASYRSPKDVRYLAITLFADTSHTLQKGAIPYGDHTQAQLVASVKALESLHEPGRISLYLSDPKLFTLLSMRLPGHRRLGNLHTLPDAGLLKRILTLQERHTLFFHLA